MHSDRRVDVVLTSRGIIREVSEEQWIAESTMGEERAAMEYEYLRSHGWVRAPETRSEPRSPSAPGS